jgi:hypothetical protein
VADDSVTITQEAPHDEFVAKLDDLREGIATLRHAARNSPLGRYQAGRARAQARIDAHDTALLAVVLRAIVDGDDDTAEFILDGMTTEEIAALGDAGRRLAEVADARTAGTR